MYDVCSPIRPPIPMKPKLTRSFAPRTRPVAGAWRALIISSNGSSALAEIKEPPADNAAAPAASRAMNSRRVDFLAMQIVLRGVELPRRRKRESKVRAVVAFDRSKSESLADSQDVRIDPGLQVFRPGRVAQPRDRKTWDKMSSCPTNFHRFSREFRQFMNDSWNIRISDE